MFVSDEPISSLSQDLLNRNPFAEALGRAILSHGDTRPLVMGLHGSWGSGKSSVLRMTKDYLEHEAAKLPDDQRPLLVTFNPWLVPDESALVEQFFDHFLAAIGQWNYSKLRKRLLRYVKTYSEVLAPAGLVPSPAGKVVGAASKGLGVIARLVAWWQGYADTLEMRKDLVSTALANQPHRVIFFIDEIDRLAASETRTLFQVVKSIANFPNTLYVLAFDRKIVASQLHEQYTDSGEAFLDKIVQVPFNIPAISEEAVDRFVRAELRKQLESFPTAEIDEGHLQRIVQFVLRPYLRDFRVAKRYLNVVALNITFNDRIRPSDLVGMCILQAFELEVFELVRTGKQLLVAATTGPGSMTGNHAIGLINGIVKPQRGGSEEVLNALLQLLFPKVEASAKARDERLVFAPEPRWRAERRICDPVAFNHYFTATLPAGEFAPGEIDSILAQCADADLIDAQVRRVITESRGRPFLEHLYSHILRTPPPPEGVRNLLFALTKYGDEFIDSPGEPTESMFRVDLSQYIVQIVRTLLGLYDNRGGSGEDTILQAIRGSSNAFAVPYLLSIQILRESTETAQLLMTRAKELYETRQILDHPRVGLIANWCESNCNKELADAICDLVYDHDLALLRVIREYATTQTTRPDGNAPEYVMNIDGLRHRLDVQRVVECLRKMQGSARANSLSPSDKSLIGTCLAQLASAS